MQVITTIEEFRQAKSGLPGAWGFVPTMGYLHEGHLSLVRRARAENDHVAVSIFVNPIQFGPNEDFATYPRDLDRDLQLLKPAGVDLVFNPTPEVMYPPGFQTSVTVDEVTRPLEGAARPGHFRGVATVVAKLLNIIQADRAYFGQKDAQQVVVVKRMTNDLAMLTEVVVCPTLREADGLAMSSRNTTLDPAQRQAAAVLYRALTAAKDRYDTGAREAEALRGAMHYTLTQEPLATVEYVSAADPDTLHELERLEDRVLLSMAVRVGRTRLIDNFLRDRGEWMTGDIVRQSNSHVVW